MWVQTTNLMYWENKYSRRFSARSWCQLNIPSNNGNSIEFSLSTQIRRGIKYSLLSPCSLVRQGQGSSLKASSESYSRLYGLEKTLTCCSHIVTVSIRNKENKYQSLSFEYKIKERAYRFEGEWGWSRAWKGRELSWGILLMVHSKEFLVLRNFMIFILTSLLHSLETEVTWIPTCVENTLESAKTSPDEDPMKPSLYIHQKTSNMLASNFDLHDWSSCTLPLSHPPLTTLDPTSPHLDSSLTLVHSISSTTLVYLLQDMNADDKKMPYDSARSNIWVQQ